MEQPERTQLRKQNTGYNSYRYYYYHYYHCYCWSTSTYSANAGWWRQKPQHLRPPCVTIQVHQGRRTVVLGVQYVGKYFHAV